MHRRSSRTAPLLALALAGCFVDVGSASGPTTTATASASSGTDADDGSDDTSTAAPPLTGDPADPTASTDSTGAAVTGDTSGGTASTTVDPGGPTSATAGPDTSEDPPAQCGDGVVGGGEACDDGNDSNADSCLADCTLASCADGYKNQDESDVDCGGPCTACGYCQLCLGDPDCATGYYCDGLRCSTGAAVTIDYFEHCGLQTNFWTDGPDLPPGTYRITADGGGGQVDPKLGFGWAGACVGLDFGEMSADFIHGAPADAFAALPVTQVDSPYDGGPLRCGVFDGGCDDNLGGVSFSLQLLCD